MFQHRAVVAAVCAVVVSAPLGAEFIDFQPGILAMQPGAAARSKARLGDNSTPLFGYSLLIEIEPDLGATGSVSIDLSGTSFFDSENLISAGGRTRDPLFSVIEQTPGGLFLSTNTHDLSTVTAIPGINDILAEVAFIASPDAMGTFFVCIASGSALSDGQGFPVAFDWEPLTINVVPGNGASLVLVATFLSRGRRARLASKT